MKAATYYPIGRATRQFPDAAICSISYLTIEKVGFSEQYAGIPRLPATAGSFRFYP